MKKTLINWIVFLLPTMFVLLLISGTTYYIAIVNGVSSNVRIFLIGAVIIMVLFLLPMSITTFWRIAFKDNKEND
jgi:hypothetical protein